MLSKAFLKPVLKSYNKREKIHHCLTPFFTICNSLPLLYKDTLFKLYILFTDKIRHFFSLYKLTTNNRLTFIFIVTAECTMCVIKMLVLAGTPKQKLNQQVSFLTLINLFINIQFNS